MTVTGTDKSVRFWGSETERCLQNLSCSVHKMNANKEFIAALATVKKAAAMATVKKAAAMANSEAGQIGSEIAKRIGRACDELAQNKHANQFPVDMLSGGGSIAFNQNINEVIASLATTADLSVEAKTHVNASQSTADSCSTAFRLALLSAAQPLLKNIDSICETLRSKIAESRGIETVARTCMQDALVAPVSSIFEGWSQALTRRRRRLEESLKLLLQVNIGGTVIGTGEGASESYRREVLPALIECSGLPLTHRASLYDAAQNSDDLGELSNALSQLAELLIKIGADLRLLSSGPEFGFGELALPMVQNGSSFFQNKNNPVVPETVMQACFHVLGNHRASQAALEHAELNLNIFESGIFFHTHDSIAVLTEALQLLNDKCLNDLTVRNERCASMVNRLQELRNDREKSVK